MVEPLSCRARAPRASAAPRARRAPSRKRLAVLASSSAILSILAKQSGHAPAPCPDPSILASLACGPGVIGRLPDIHEDIMPPSAQGSSAAVRVDEGLFAKVNGV